MEVKNYIKTFDNILRLESLSSFLKFINNKGKFDIAGVASGKEDVVDRDIRRTEVFPLHFHSSEKTKTHWFYYLANTFGEVVREYNRQVSPFENIPMQGFSDISVLKYRETGFYKYHTDHHFRFPRTLSLIYLLNNDYEGGELEFGCSVTNESLIKIPTKPNMAIVWPSNFMYPHRVNPVTKGVRYSVVAWAH